MTSGEPETEPARPRSTRSRFDTVCAVVSATCRVVAVLCALGLGWVLFRSLMNETSVEGFARFGEGVLIAVITLVLLVVLLTVMCVPTFAYTDRWWMWLVNMLPVVLAYGLWIWWLGADSEADPQQGAIAAWFAPLFWAIPALLLIGQIAGGPVVRGDRVRRLLAEEAAREERLLQEEAGLRERARQREAGLERFRDRPVRGRPGLGVSGRDRFGDAADAGSWGERLTAAVIDAWAHEDESVTVFHGLQFPGSDKADVDHAVVVGRRVALLDSKRWRSGHYEFDEHGYLIRDGSPFKGGDVHMADAVDAYASKWSAKGVVVTGWIVLVPGEGSSSGITVDNAQAPEQLQLVTLNSEESMAAVRDWLREGDDAPRLSVLAAVNRSLLHPPACARFGQRW